MSYEEKEIAEIKEKLAQLIGEALPGKCPIGFTEIDNKKNRLEKSYLKKTLQIFE
mgnify:FL=1